MLERFKPTTGMFVGSAGVALAVFAIGYVALTVRTLVGLRIALAAGFVAVLVWVWRSCGRASRRTPAG